MGQKSLRDKAEFLIRGHLLNWPWRDSARRAAVRADVVADLVVRHFRLPAGVHAAQCDRACAGGEKIFSIWFQGADNAPEIVKACWRSVRRHCPQELVVLDEKTLFDYIRLPDVIVDKYRRGIIGRAHFSDICRLELLYRYGGYWMDATAFVTQPIPQKIVDSDFFIYMVGRVGFPYSFVQNCFIRAKQGNYLLAAWRAIVLDYWMRSDNVLDYFMHQLAFKKLVMCDARAATEFARMPRMTDTAAHSLWHAHNCRDVPFDDALFKDWTKDAFFQKLTYKDAENPRPGSFLEELIKM